MDNTQIVKHSTVPVNAKPNGQYEPFDNIDFTLDFNNRAIVMNSIKISGRVAVRKNNDVIVQTDKVYFDNNIGAHSFFDTITSSTENQGTLETIQEYARYVGMKSDTSQTTSDLGGNLSRTVELKTFQPDITQLLLRYGETNVDTGDNGGVVYNDPSFVVMPDIVFNNAQGAKVADDVRISYTKTGSLKLSLRVARVSEALYGEDMDSTVTFTLSDVKCQFLSLPDDNPSNIVVVETKAHVKQSILSRQSNLSVRVPMVANSFSATFLPSQETNSLIDNANRRAAVNDLQNLQFLFNNNTMELITYEMSDRGEILRHYEKSMSMSTKNQLAPYKNSGLSGYGIGLEFQPVDLTNNSFNVNLEADSFQTQSYVVFGYFKGILSV